MLGDRTKKGEIEVENTRTGEKVLISQCELAKQLIKFNQERIGNPDISLEDTIKFQPNQEKEIVR